MYFLLKRLFDIIVSFFLAIFFFPLFVFSILLILIIDCQRPLFIQERSGLNGKKIKIIKLQTMKFFDGKIKITNLGRLLRLTKIDELPQLLNVIKNDMSLIGPRPLFLEFNNFYKNKHKYRIKIKPGITGLAQIKIKDSTDWNRKFNFDYIYFKRSCFSLDLYIIFKTIFIIFNSILKKNERPIECLNYKKSFIENYIDD